jgi:hypothetical protein
MKLTQSFDQVMQSHSVGLAETFYEASTFYSSQKRISHTRDGYVQSIRPNGSQERKYVVQAAKGETAPPILCIIKAGTGVGLRTKAHTKRGGTKMRQSHRGIQ